MSPVKNRRRLPTLVNRGLGLLEVILPRGTSETEESALPPGKRDSSGFWFPAGYSGPADIFTPLQRELQENQRRIQRRRVRSNGGTRVDAGATNAGPRGGKSAAAHAPSAIPVANPDGPVRFEAETSMPLPPLQTESRLPQPPAPEAGLRAPAGPPLLPGSDPRGPRTARLVVDSREGSD